MEKTYTTRNNKREDNLTTTEAILKVLTRIYWMKKEGKPYFVSVICDECRVMHLNKNIVESLYDWKELPTWSLAEEYLKNVVAPHKKVAEAAYINGALDAMKYIKDKLMEL